MPLMPAPPMPTKWTRLTLCFMSVAPGRRKPMTAPPPGAANAASVRVVSSAPRELEADVRDALRRAGLAQRTCAHRHRGELRPVERLQPLRQALRRDIALHLDLRAAAANQLLCVVGLVVVGRVRKRNQEAV